MKTISVLRWGTYTNVVRNINLIRLASRNFSIINLSRRYGHVILVSGHLVLTGVSGSQHGCPIPKKYTVNQGCMSLCQPVIWSMAAILRDSTVVVVAAAAVVCTRPWAIPLAMITMRKSIHGFPFVSHIWLLMGLRLAALRAAGAPLTMLIQEHHLVAN